MVLRRYAVTVMDCWTPTRFFWTRRGARRWFCKFGDEAHLFAWGGTSWIELS